MELLVVKLNINDNLTVTGYYFINNSQYEKIYEWYNSFMDTIVLSDLILTPSNLTVEKHDFDQELYNSINKWSNPFPILESIDEISYIFDTDVVEDNSESELDESLLYTETENISRLIDAHKEKNDKDIKMLLSVITTKNDPIVKRIQSSKNNK